MKFDQKISSELFTEKYMHHGEKSPLEVFQLIARNIASAEKSRRKQLFWEDSFFQEMASGRFIPGGRILANARPNTPNPFYSNCYTIDIEDTIDGIYTALKEDAVISATGGGVGFDVSKLRPDGDPTSKGGTSSGPISFLKVFNESAKQISVAGNRRGAHIALLDISHPDVEKFITCKQGDINKELDKFNISVRITDAFMQAVEQDQPWDLTFNGKVYKTLPARELYELLISNAFIHNEPGVFFLDTAERFNTGWWAFKTDRTNPCGEISMPPYSLCDLGALNLPKFVRGAFSDQVRFDFTKLEETIATSIRFLDNVLDVTKYPLPKIEQFSKKWRRIGLGFTGLGDALAMMKLPYGSTAGNAFCEQLARTIRDAAYRNSSLLAKEKGKFPSYDKKYLEGAFVTQLPPDIKESIKKYGIRNVAMLTIAPTGTISLTVGQNCSGGIEPIFALEYNRTIRTGVGDETRTEKVFDYAWKEYLYYISKDDESEKEITPPYYFVTAQNLDPYKSIDVQAIFQRYIDHSISKTANLPPGYTKDQYRDLFAYAYKKGLKGYTSFNPQGSLKGILDVGSTEQASENREAPKRPKSLPCDIHTVTVKGQKYILLVGLLDGRPYEVFTSEYKDEYEFVKEHKVGTIYKVKKGQYQLIVTNGEEKLVIDNITQSFNPDYEAMSRLLSITLRHRTPIEFVVEQLGKTGHFGTWGKMVAVTLKKYIIDGEVKSSQACPACGSTNLRYVEGCLSCLDCGQSRCG